MRNGSNKSQNNKEKKKLYKLIFSFKVGVISFFKSVNIYSSIFLLLIYFNKII